MIQSNHPFSQRLVKEHNAFVSNNASSGTTASRDMKIIQKLMNTDCQAFVRTLKKLRGRNCNVDSMFYMAFCVKARQREAGVEARSSEEQAS